MFTVTLVQQIVEQMLAAPDANTRIGLQDSLRLLYDDGVIEQVNNGVRQAVADMKLKMIIVKRRGKKELI